MEKNEAGAAVTAQRMLSLARDEVGVREDPPGSNRVKYNTAYYGRAVSGEGYPWCCVFVWWLFQKAGAPALFYGGGKTASCGALASYARENGLWIQGDYRPGDLVFLRFQGAAIQHIGLVEENRGRELVTIEGNTAAGSDANGGQVQRRVRAVRYAAGGWRPRYEEETDMEKKETEIGAQRVYETLSHVPEIFRDAIGQLMQAGILLGDGTGRIDLSHRQVRTLVMVYRGGGFDRKLKEAGLPPAVQ